MSRDHVVVLTGANIMGVSLDAAGRVHLGMGYWESGSDPSRPKVRVVTVEHRRDSSWG